MNKTLKVCLIIFSIIIILYVLSEIFIPVAASKYVRREIEKRYPEAKDVTVSVRAFPAFRLLFKKYSRLKVSAKEITVEGVRFDSVSLESKSYPQADVEGIISEERINEMFSSSSSFVINPKITLLKSNINVYGRVNLSFGSFYISANGNLEVRDGREIYFIPQSIEVLGARAPEQILSAIQSIANETPLLVVRKDLPITLSSVVSEPGKLIASGKLDLKAAFNLSL